MTEGANITVTGGSNVVSNFTLKSGNLSITGKVVSKDGNAIDSEVYLYRNGIVVTTRKTSKTGDGTFAFTDLVSDRYEIGVIASEYVGNGWAGKLEKPEVVNFELEKMQEPIQSSSFHH